MAALSDWNSGVLYNYSSSFDIKDASCNYGEMSQSIWPYGRVFSFDGTWYSLNGQQQLCGQCYEIICDNQLSDDGACKTHSSQLIQSIGRCDGCRTPPYGTPALNVDIDTVKLRLPYSM